MSLDSPGATLLSDQVRGISVGPAFVVIVAIHVLFSFSQGTVLEEVLKLLLMFFVLVDSKYSFQRCLQIG